MPYRDAPRSPSFWQMQILGWVCFYIFVLAGSVPDLLRRPGALRDNTLGFVFMFLCSCGLHPICRALFRRSLPWLAFELAVSLWSLLAGTAGAVGLEFTVLGMERIPWADLTGASVQFSVVLFLWCNLYFSIKQWQRSTLERERVLRAEADARDARLSALRYQLNPHFLFNALNAVSTLVLEGSSSSATRMLAQIGEFLRTSLDEDMTPEVTLSQEMAYTERYLAIEQTRMGERLQVALDIAPETLSARVPIMILQPLIENAVRHGVAPLVEGGTIAIESGLRAGRVRIVIRNSGRRATVL